jgi:hypothetical protein
MCRCAISTRARAERRENRRMGSAQCAPGMVPRGPIGQLFRFGRDVIRGWRWSRSGLRPFCDRVRLLLRVRADPVPGSVLPPSQSATSVNTAVRPAARDGLHRGVESVCLLPNQSSRGNACIRAISIYRYFSNSSGIEETISATVSITALPSERRVRRDSLLIAHALWRNSADRFFRFSGRRRSPQAIAGVRAEVYSRCRVSQPADTGVIAGPNRLPQTDGRNGAGGHAVCPALRESAPLTDRSSLPVRPCRHHAQ